MLEGWHYTVPDQGPFVHCFQTSASHYIYDVPSNRILRATPWFWRDMRAAFEPEWPSGPGMDGRGHWVREHLAKWVLRARMEHDVFQPSRPPKAALVLTRDHIEARLRGHLLLHVTNQCNMRCTYCVFSGEHQCRPPHGDERMVWATARAALDFYVGNHEPAVDYVTQPPIVSFIGGEPLLDLALIQRCVDYARARFPDVRFAITTNGTLLTGEAADFLVAHDFLVSVSLDGPQHVHDRRRVFADGRGSFQQVADNLTALKRVSPAYYQHNLKLQVVVSSTADLPTIADFFDASDLTPDNPMHIGLSRVMMPGGLPQIAKQEESRVPDREALVSAVSRHGAFAMPLPSAIQTWMEPLAARGDEGLSTATNLAQGAPRLAARWAVCAGRYSGLRDARWQVLPMPEGAASPSLGDRFCRPGSCPGSPSPVPERLL